MNDAAIAELLAKQAIADQLHRYCRAMDRMDDDLGRSVFHPDAPADYGAMYKGTGHGFIDYVHAQHARMIRHQHQLGNVLIEVDGDRAFSESYVTVTFRMRGADGRLLGIETHGRYVDRWEKRGGHWAVADRLYLHAMDETRPVPENAFPAAGMRDRTDPSYRR